MQTFIVDFDLKVSFAILDQQRLVKQLLESLQIAQCLIETQLLNSYTPNQSQQNHPVVKMWVGHEDYLYKYMVANSEELLNRGLAVDSHMHDAVHRFNRLIFHNGGRPKWITQEFIDSHQQALLYKAAAKHSIYKYSQFARIPICDVAENYAFRQHYQHLFLTYDYMPKLTDKKIATLKMINAAEEVATWYEFNFEQMSTYKPYTISYKYY